METSALTVSRFTAFAVYIVKLGLICLRMLPSICPGLPRSYVLSAVTANYELLQLLSAEYSTRLFILTSINFTIDHA